MKKVLFAAVAALVMAASCGPKDFVFIQMSDPQIGYKDKTEGYRRSDSLMMLAVGDINRIKPEVVIVTGDLVNHTYDSLQVAIYSRDIKQIDPEIPVYAIPGNHDMRPWTPENHEAFLKFNGYERFSFKLHDCAFIGFDTCCIKDGIELITCGSVGKPLHGGYSGINIIRVTKDNYYCEYKPLGI